jgi:hypothetical protein
MDAGELRDRELEQELDILYRKVSGLDRPSEGHEKPTAAGAGLRKKRRRFRIGVLLCAAFALLSLGAFAVFREWRRPTADTGVIALTADETRLRPNLSVTGKAQANPNEERYAIQIRAYPRAQRQKALSFLADLRKRVPAASMETVSIAGRGVWHRILLGDFSTAEEAAAYRERDRVAREHPYRFIQKKFGKSAGEGPPPRSPYPGS